METEYKLYITNPQYFNSNQNDFEKNLSGKIVVKEVLLNTGFTEKTAVGYVYGITVPFKNPQTNSIVEENNGSMILNGEPSLFSPPKVLVNEMLATIKDIFFKKYGVNIDFSIDAPIEVSNEKNGDNVATKETEPAETSGTSGSSGFKFNFDQDLGKKVMIGAGVLAAAGGAALGSIGIKSLIDENKGKSASSPTIAPIVEPSTKPTIAPIEDNKIKGIKILVPSQYIDVYEISKYGGAPALVTTKDSKQMVWLDKDYDRPEFLPSNLTSPLKVNDDLTGDFKINIHLGYPGGKKVGNWSEDGSQVFSTADELNDFFSLCEKHREMYGNKLTYTLSTKSDWDEAQKNVQTNKAAPPDIPIAPTPIAIEEKIIGSPSTPISDVKEVLEIAFKNLNFDTDKDIIRAESFPSLDKLAELLKKETSWKLKVEGHTDNTGSSTHNLDLSKRRAAATKKYLVNKGVAEEVIKTEGYGENKPIGDNKTVEGRQKNRRVVFTIIKTDNTTIIVES